MSGYTKLFNSILASTVWREDDSTRLVWITMLAMSDKAGIVEASVPGLADFARVPLQACVQALERLSAPDKWSRSKVREGRRIEAIEGGWRLVNHDLYRNTMNADERREYLKLKQREYRARKKEPVNDVSTNGDNVRDTDTELTHTPPPPPPTTPPEADPPPERKRLAHSRKRADARFDTFWHHYPRKVGKEAACRVWERLAPTDEVVDTILKALRWQSQRPEWTKDQGQFIPHPSTWLHQHRWEDEPMISVDSSISVRSQQNLRAVESAAARLKGVK